VSPKWSTVVSLLAVDEKIYLALFGIALDPAADGEATGIDETISTLRAGAVPVRCVPPKNRVADVCQKGLRWSL
jgi:hypothetical protein